MCHWVYEEELQISWTKSLWRTISCYTASTFRAADVINICIILTKIGTYDSHFSFSSGKDISRKKGEHLEGSSFRKENIDSNT